MLLAASSQAELSQLVAQNIVAFDAKFWLHLAARSDAAAAPEDKEALRGLADSVMTLVDAVIKQTDRQLSDSSKLLQDILKAAADENGEWYMPLAAAQVASLRAALAASSDRLDEALLSNCFAWMRKCGEDGMDSMLALLQKVLQLYAAAQLHQPGTQGAEALVNDVVWAEAADWDRVVRSGALEGGVSEAAFMDALQRKMEATVLGLQSGSYAQRVQAEYLKEVEARAKSVYRECAAASAGGR